MKLSKRRTNHKHTEYPRKTHVNKLNGNENTTTGQVVISTVTSSSKSKIPITANGMNRKNVYHWGSSCEIIETIRK